MESQTIECFPALQNSDDYMLAIIFMLAYLAKPANMATEGYELNNCAIRFRFDQGIRI